MTDEQNYSKIEMGKIVRLSPAEAARLTERARLASLPIRLRLHRWRRASGQTGGPYITPSMSREAKLVQEKEEPYIDFMVERAARHAERASYAH
jgi:hypothetical protein